MSRWALLIATPVLSTFIGVTAIAVVATLTASACPAATGEPGDQPSAAAIREIPAQLLPIYEQVGAQYALPWEVLAGIGNQECSLGRLADPSGTLQLGATGPGVANYAGASGLMQVGVSGAAGDEYDSLRQYLPNPSLGPHDPTTAVQLAALVLTKHKGAPTGQPIDAYLPYARAYNGSGPRRRRVRQPRDRRRPPLPGKRSDGSCRSRDSLRCRQRQRRRLREPVRTRPVTASRVDQGVDYGGSGPIDALGPGRILLVSTTDSGWGNGDGWVSYQLTGGTYAGDYVYVAEGITPTVHAGDQVNAGQQIGTFNGHSIEIGFALGQGDLALAHSIYQEGADTAAGQTMNELLVTLGAPAGHRDPTSCGGPYPVVGGRVPRSP